MTTTVPAHVQMPAAADDLQIIPSPPTIADAQLIVQLQTMDSISGATRGWELLRAFETPPTLGQLRKRYPPGSAESLQIWNFLASSETLAAFVKNGLLSEALVNDVFWVKGAWVRCEKICKGLRKENGEPGIYENFEWLARRAS